MEECLLNTSARNSVWWNRLCDELVRNDILVAKANHWVFSSMNEKFTENSGILEKKCHYCKKKHRKFSWLEEKVTEKIKIISMDWNKITGISKQTGKQIWTLKCKLVDE